MRGKNPRFSLFWYWEQLELSKTVNHVRRMILTVESFPCLFYLFPS